jgi:hypothetical protein
MTTSRRVLTPKSYSHKTAMPVWKSRAETTACIMRKGAEETSASRRPQAMPQQGFRTRVSDKIWAIHRWTLAAVGDSRYQGF